MKVANTNRTYTVWPHVFNMDTFLAFLGWYVAEGSTDKRNGCQISVACCNIDGGKEKRTILNIINFTGYPKELDGHILHHQQNICAKK